MENDIKFLRIQNFKSIKDVTLHPSRVNLIIGEPNVGKSNLLEALTLLGAGLLERNEKFLDDVIRYETVSNLFYDNYTGQPIIVESSNALAVIKTSSLQSSGYHFISASKEVLNAYKQQRKLQHEAYMPELNLIEETDWEILDIMTGDGPLVEAVLGETRSRSRKQAYLFKYRLQEDGTSSQLGLCAIPPQALPRPYKYLPKQPHDSIYRDNFLEPPFGHNLSNIVQRNPALRKEIGLLFKHYGLSLVLRVSERKFEIQKQVDDLVYNYPYSLIADTLQRIIFYLAAIESNDDAVLLFEEPEAHSFPVYVSKLGRRIVESRNNQFFIDTHSPYLITEILETMLTDDAQAGELAMFAAYYEDHQTKVHQLSDEEIRSIRADGIDVFYNMKRFTTGAAHNA
ncbi:AAA family ATPase [Hymenobacter glaciei]|uniref:AAA family ATPase n=1 Tax=Hymenobacter glaciei TaxID=877209 RepID=UPI0031EF61AD